MTLAILFALVLPCAQAAPVRATPTQQKEILDDVKEGLQAREAANVFVLRMNAVETTDPEEWERLSWLEKAERAKANASFELAIKKTTEFYGISPSGLRIGDSAPARQGPMINTQIKWSPRVLDDNHLAIKYADALGATRYESAPLTRAVGFTDSTGQVSIHIGMLEQIVDYDHPGLLAYLVHHEAAHFDEKISRPERTREESEISAYQQTLKLVDIFEMGSVGKNPSKTQFLASRAQWISDIKQLNAEHAAALSAGTGRSVYMTPAEEQTAKGIFEFDQRELARIQAKTAGIKLAAARIRIEREDRLRREAEAEDARRAAAAWRMLQYRSAASNCGLVPKMTRDGRTYGFKDSDNINVEFTEPVTLDQAKAAMMMARACSDGERDYPQANPCTDALGAMRANWGNAGFRHGLELDADAGHIDGCLRAIRENGEPPSDMRALNKRVSRYLREWKDANRRRELIRQNTRSRESEEAGRRTRGDAEERSGRVPDQNYDLTPARRALENARRSHF